MQEEDDGAKKHRTSAGSSSATTNTESRLSDEAMKNRSRQRDNKRKSKEKQKDNDGAVVVPPAVTSVNGASSRMGDTITTTTATAASRSSNRKARHMVKEKEQKNSTQGSSSNNKDTHRSHTSDTSERNANAEDGLDYLSSSDEDSVPQVGAVRINRDGQQQQQGMMERMESGYSVTNSTNTNTNTNTDRMQSGYPASREPATHVAVVAELVPENDEVQEENERLRNELKKEREERDRQQPPLAIITTSAEPMLDLEPKPRVKRRWLICGGIMLLLVIVGVSVGVTVGPDDTIEPPTSTVVTVSTSPPSISSKPTNEPTHPPTMLPTKEPTSSPTETPRFDLLLEYLLTEDPNLERQVFFNTSSSQYQALTWLAEEDDMALELQSFSTLALDRFVMALFFFSLSGEKWRNQYRFLSKSTVCDWSNGDLTFFQGIACNDGGRIATISMNDNQVRGSLPTELWLLTDLKRINFGFDLESSLFNAVSGSLPEIIGKVTALTHLHFRGNIMEGTIPTTLGELTALTHLNFFGNHLEGNIPTHLGALTLLTHLNFGYMDHINGTIPSELSSLTDLNHLELHTTALEGTVPTELGSLTKLTYLSLRENYELKGDLDFLCTADFDWQYFSSDCSLAEEPTICSCCTICYC